MRTIALILILLCCSAQAIELVKGKVVVTPDEMKTLAVCKEQGGCTVWSNANIDLLLMIHSLMHQQQTCRKEKTI